jgi:DNA invertase Pin-like site-specific DNA recombinase
MERDLIHERTMEGVRIAKAAGKYKGRKPKELPHDYHRIMKQWVNGEISAASACRYFGCNTVMFYR